eukprot:2358588-Rhodomonas_salina.2
MNCAQGPASDVKVHEEAAGGSGPGHRNVEVVSVVVFDVFGGQSKRSAVRVPDFVAAMPFELSESHAQVTAPDGHAHGQTAARVDVEAHLLSPSACLSAGEPHAWNEISST